ncbi:MAG TPA: phosphoribosylformylglycinamidine synthase subunit PurS [Candidatus Cloacimonadota bacterium]|nr:phosphoribosylformylglycinamidine synthase subunit PurS [Candidatus Cloacimonadota bacterium]
MLKARIFVQLKPSVLDPQGKAVTNSLHSLGYTSVTDTRVSKYIEMNLCETDEAKAAEIVNSICDKLLANPNTEHYEYSIEKVGD